MFLFIIFFMYWRSFPRILAPNTYVVDTLIKYNHNCIFSPTIYSIMSTGNVTVSILDYKNYNKMIQKELYSSIFIYHLKPDTYHKINLTQHYDDNTKSYYVITRNNNKYHISLKWNYIASNWNIFEKYLKNIWIV